MTKSYWALGARDARLRLPPNYTRHTFSAFEGQAAMWSYNNGYRFAEDMMTREKVASPVPAKPDPATYQPPQRFKVVPVENPEGFDPGDYFFVRDTRTGLKVSRMVKRYSTAAEKAYRYNVKNAAATTLGEWPEVGRVRELIDSRYVVPTFREKHLMQLYVVLHGSNPDAVKAQRQLKLWAHREEVAKRERQLLKDITFLDRYGTSSKKLTAFSEPSGDRKFRSDFGDVRPESVGNTYPYIVVGVERDGQTQWFVQKNGVALSIRTDSAYLAELWASLYKHDSPNWDDEEGADRRGIPSEFLAGSPEIIQEQEARNKRYGVPR